MTWQTRAACRDSDPELFFPATDDDTSVLVARARIAVAPICSACPVATDCLRWALDSGQDYGLWAATTPTDRRAIRRARLQGTPQPGRRRRSRVLGLRAAVPDARRGRGAVHRLPREDRAVTVDHTHAAPGWQRTGRGRGLGVFLARHRARRAQREYEASVLVFADGLRGEFREACTGLGLCQYVQVAAGVTVRTPRVGEVRVGPPLSFTVELLPGQEPHDFTRKENAPRLAHSLGGHGLRVEPIAGRWVRLVVLDDDPLRDGYGLPSLAVASGAESVLIGRTEDGSVLGHAFADAASLGVQGANGSGKSAFGYGLLSQLAAAPDVLVAGSDITGLLLGRAWDGTAHRPHQVVGTADLGAHAVLLEDLVAEMDRRLEHIPPRADKVVPSPTLPTVVVVLEEFPGLLRAADSQPKPKKSDGLALGDRIRTAVLRLLSEGRKAAFRVLMLAQRFEATAVAGGYARDQFALRLSFRVPADSLVMLHGDDARPLGQEHANAAPGIAYLSGLGRDCERIRVPYLGDYAEYVGRVQRHGRRAES